MAIADRMMRAAKADKDLFEEVEHDTTATSQAMMVVAIVAIAGGIGGAIGGLLYGGHPNSGPLGIVAGVASSLIGWGVFSGVAFFVGSKLFAADVTWEELLRTLGFAYTPSIVAIVGWVPVIGGILVIAAAFWGLYVAFVAIRSALDLSNGKTAVTILLSIIPAAIIIAIIQAPLMRMR
jgi:hypothetical protein